jgi:hypothetical protein
MEIIYRSKIWVTKDSKEIIFRDITNTNPKKGKIIISDEEMSNIVSRMIYAYQAYQTKGHDLERCLCTGCRYARNARYFLGGEICNKLKRNW